MLFLSIFTTLIAIFFACSGLINRASRVYTYMIGSSGVLWGITIAIIVIYDDYFKHFGILRRLLFLICTYVFLFIFYWSVVPDIIITGWGPIPDRLASWAIGGILSIASLVITLIIIAVSCLLLKVFRS